MLRLGVLILTVVLLLAGDSRPAKGGLFASSQSEKPVSFEREIKPVLAKYCYSCHGEAKQKGDLNLESFGTVEAIEKNPKVWETVLHHVHSHEMPPENKPQPSTSDRDLLSGWIERQLFHFDPQHPDPGRVTIRRLNRSEYNHTIHDLVGVDFQPAADFPPDDSGYGFDNIGDVLSLPPMLMEKYLNAADRILAQAIPAETNGSKGVPGRPMPEPMQNLFKLASTRTNEVDQARFILGQFARRAWRRPVAEPEMERLLKLRALAAENGEDFRGSLRLALKAVLVSPHFLFLGETPAGRLATTNPVPLDEYALASRLSYFIWSSLPDDELLELAAKGKLRRNLDVQVRRMLASPKAQALVQDFAGQWLQTRSLRSFVPDPAAFPGFDEPLRDAMGEETSRFFEYVLRQDRSVVDFLNADYTFANERLARFYGLTNVTGSEFRKVSLSGTPRRGVLTQGSILLLTSNSTRTSPVKRGKWVLENLLGTPPPPPPPDVPPLKNEGKPISGTLRHQMEEHRENPICASCHARMDPIGFGLENFDGVGAWRTKEGEFPIDAGGNLAGGEAFSGAVDLTTILAGKKREEFLRCIARKMLTYSLGRGLEYYDRPAIDQIVKELSKDRYHFSGLVLAVARSVPFQLRRGGVDAPPEAPPSKGATP